jgi:hypothetical protein
MRINFLSLLGIGFFVLSLFSAWRVRRDLASTQTRFEPALFRSRTPISRETSPVRYWLAIALNTALVLMFALVAVFAFRATALRIVR